MGIIHIYIYISINGDLGLQLGLTLMNGCTCGSNSNPIHLGYKPNHVVSAATGHPSTKLKAYFFDQALQLLAFYSGCSSQSFEPQ